MHALGVGGTEAREPVPDGGQVGAGTGVVTDAADAGGEGGDARVGAEARGVGAQVAPGLGGRNAGAVGIVEVAALDATARQSGEGNNGGF